MATATLQPRGMEYIPSLNHEHQIPYFEYPSTSTAKEVLPGFPTQYTGERVWVGSEMALKQDEWIVTLSEQDQSHILKALRHFQGM
jgi:hypothetical protein